MDTTPKDNTGGFWATPKRVVAKGSGREFDSYSGSCNVACPHCGKREDYWINGLLKDTTRGKVFDLTFKLKRPIENPLEGIF